MDHPSHHHVLPSPLSCPTRSGIFVLVSVSQILRQKPLCLQAEYVDIGDTFAGKPWKIPLRNPRPATGLQEKRGRSFHYWL